MNKAETPSINPAEEHVPTQTIWAMVFDPLSQDLIACPIGPNHPFDMYMHEELRGYTCDIVGGVLYATPEEALKNAPVKCSAQAKADFDERYSPGPKMCSRCPGNENCLCAMRDESADYGW